MLQAEALPRDQIGAASSVAEERNGAAQRRLFRLQRSAAAGRRGGAVDRRARRAGRRPRKRDAARGQRPRARPRTLSLRSMCRRSIIPPSTVMRCAPTISTAEGDKRLAIVDRVAAGHAASHAIKAGEAIRIFTGAPMPAGADTVFMQEDCRVDGDRRHRAAGLEARRQPPAGRRGHPGRRRRVAGRPAACGAACGACGGARPHQARCAPARAGRAVLDRR